MIEHLDEVRLGVMPIAFGGATPFLALVDHLPLRLVEHGVFDSGAVYLRYEAAEGARA
ncbi:MAG: hypothetical protein WD225_13260 [Ilumatobacteraceae bacterium]